MKQVFKFSRRLNNADAKFFFLGRRKECNVAMVMVAILPREFALDELVDEFAQYEEEIPRFADYLRRAPLNIAPPVWMPLPLSERRPEYYGREISMPAGASWQDVFAKVDEIQSTPFQAKRAPWEIVLVNGAPNGRSALVMKVHHTLSDGMVLAILFAKAFAADVLAEANAPIEVATELPPRGPRLWVALCDRGAALRHWLSSVAGSLPEMAERDWRQRELAVASKMLRPPLRWPLKSYRPARRLAGFRVPKAAWESEARTRGGGSNELYLALVARIMRKSFDSEDFDADPLRVAMPISVRGGRGVHDGGNTVVVGIVELAGGADDLTDLTAVRERASVAKRSAAESSSTLFEETLDLLPGSLRAAIEFRRAASCDVLATNVPIPIEGRLLDVPIEMMLMVAPAIGQAVSFSLTTYGDYLYLASNSDRGIVASPLDRCIEEALGEVFGDRFESFHGGALQVV